MSAPPPRDQDCGVGWHRWWHEQPADAGSSMLGRGFRILVANARNMYVLFVLVYLVKQEDRETSEKGAYPALGC